MSLTTRAMGALAVLSLAAIPVTALSIQSTSWDDTSVAAGKGGEAPGDRVAAGAPVKSRDCSSDCTVGEAQHASRLVAQNITLDTDIGSLASADHAQETHALLPQNPGVTTGLADEPSRIETSSTHTEPASTPHRKRIVKRKKVAKNAAGAGSFQLLFQGTGK